MTLLWIGIAALLTMASRYLPLWAGQRLGARLGRGRSGADQSSGQPDAGPAARFDSGTYLDRLPVAVLSALAVQAALPGRGSLPVPDLVALAVATLVAWVGRNLLLTLLVALAADVAARALGL